MFAHPRAGTHARTQTHTVTHTQTQTQTNAYANDRPNPSPCTVLSPPMSLTVSFRILTHTQHTLHTHTAHTHTYTQHDPHSVGVLFI